MSKKKRKTPRKSKGAAAKNAAAPSPFARSAPVTFGRPTLIGQRPPSAWTHPRAGPNPTESRRRQVRKLLERNGVASDLADKIADMDPNRFYVIEIYGYQYIDNDDNAAPGDVPIKQALLVGSGASLWSRLIGYSARSPIEHVEIGELDVDHLDRPIWDGDSVVTIDGERFYGIGGLKEWRDQKKMGRKPSRKGKGRNKTEKRKSRKAGAAAAAREAATNKRIQAMKKAGDHLGAQRLLARSKAHRKPR